MSKDNDATDKLAKLVPPAAAIGAELLSPAPGVATAVGVAFELATQWAVDWRRSKHTKRIEKFLEPILDEWLSGDKDEVQRQLEGMPPEVEEALFEDMRAAVAASTPIAAHVAARLFLLERRDPDLKPRRVRWARNLVAALDERSAVGIARFARKTLDAWPEELAAYSATLTLRGSEVELTPLLAGDHHRLFTIEDADGVFDLLTQHFFRFEGPAPLAGDNYALGSTFGTLPMVVTTRGHIEFIAVIFGA